MKPAQAAAFRRARRDIVQEEVDATIKGVIANRRLPTQEDRDRLEARARRIAREARTCPAASRNGKSDRFRETVGQLIYAERVLLLDPLERAAGVSLEASQKMATVSSSDLEARVERLFGAPRALRVQARASI